MVYTTGKAKIGTPELMSKYEQMNTGSFNCVINLNEMSLSTRKTLLGLRIVLGCANSSFCIKLCKNHDSRGLD